MRHKKLVIISIIISFLVIAGIVTYFVFFHKEKIEQSVNTGTSRGTSQPIVITKENFPEYLEKSSLVKDLPDNSVIALQFYNFDTGERQWEETYTITKNSVVLGKPENPDFSIIMHSMFIPKLNSLCNAIKAAQNQGHFGIEYEMSKSKLLLKYKRMNKYKDCLGF